MNKKIFNYSLFNSLGIIIYIGLIAGFMQNAEKIFGKINNFFGPFVFLLLFVISAATTGFLMFGRPIMLYLDGEKKDAVKMILSEFAWLFMFLLIALSAFYFLK